MFPTLKSTGGAWVTLGPNLGVFPLEQTALQITLLVITQSTVLPVA